MTFKKYKNENKKVYNRIMLILNRILILTLLYQIIFLCEAIFEYFAQVQSLTAQHINTVVNQLWFSVGAIVSILWSLSMYLMQEHNTKSYKQFLYSLDYLKLDYILCYCCKSWIKEEIRRYSGCPTSPRIQPSVDHKQKNKSDDTGNTVTTSTATNTNDTMNSLELVPIATANADPLRFDMTVTNGINDDNDQRSENDHESLDPDRTTTSMLERGEAKTERL